MKNSKINGQNRQLSTMRYNVNKGGGESWGWTKTRADIYKSGLGDLGVSFRRFQWLLHCRNGYRLSRNSTAVQLHWAVLPLPQAWTQSRGRCGGLWLWRTVRHPLPFIPAAASLWSMYLWHRTLNLEGSCSAAWVTTARAGQYRIIFHRSCDFLFHMPMCLEIHKMFSGIPLGILWIYSCYYFLSNPIIFEKFLAIHQTETDTLFWITF